MDIDSKMEGFTLIEVLVTLGIIAVLASMVIAAVNPGRQFKLARDSQRAANVSALLNAIHEDVSEHRGSFTCAGSVMTLPPVPSFVMSGLNPPFGQAIDLGHCLVPDYLPTMPFDPSKYGAYYSSESDYNTGYQVWQDQSGRVTASSSGELSPSISDTR